jgi:uncharacterized protein YhbP (UPF0306 family)
VSNLLNLEVHHLRDLLSKKEMKISLIKRGFLRSESLLRITKNYHYVFDIKNVHKIIITENHVEL